VPLEQSRFDDGGLRCFCFSLIPDENSMVWPQPQSQTLHTRVGYVASSLAFLHGDGSLVAAFDRSTSRHT
tara:strand:- start:385 stop:594 length:210 start_codon:yes stop_codon:yes gene_type:complete